MQTVTASMLFLIVFCAGIYNIMFFNVRALKLSDPAADEFLYIVAYLIMYSPAAVFALWVIARAKLNTGVLFGLAVIGAVALVITAEAVFLSGFVKVLRNWWWSEYFGVAVYAVSVIVYCCGLRLVCQFWEIAKG